MKEQETSRKHFFNNAQLRLERRNIVFVKYLNLNLFLRLTKNISQTYEFNNVLYILYFIREFI